eukprot:7309608-Prymnesium_polylepis.1
MRRPRARRRRVSFPALSCQHERISCSPGRLRPGILNKLPFLSRDGQSQRIVPLPAVEVVMQP